MSILKFPNKIQYLHNNDFKTIIIKIMFPIDFTKENIALNAMLPQMLSYMTKNYPNEEDLVLEKKKRCLIGSNIYNYSVGTNGCLCYEFVIPDSTCLNNNLFDSQFELMEEIIYNPKIINDQFDLDDYERELKNTKLGLDSIDKNMRSYQHTKLINLVDDQGILSLSLYNYKQYLDKVNTSNLYDYYKEVIKRTPFIFVFGNIDENIFNKLFYKYIIKSNKKNIIVKGNYDNYLNNYRDVYQYYEEKKDFKDSALSIVYKIRNYNKNDGLYLRIVSSIMNSMSTRVLDNKLRGDHDLVYGSRCSIYRHYGLFEITTFINKDNKDMVLEKIFEVMDELKNIDYITPLLDRIIEGERISLLKMLDLKYSLFDDYIFSYLDLDIKKTDFYHKLLDVKPIDIINFLNRFVVDTIYYLEEGDSND